MKTWFFIKEASWINRNVIVGFIAILFHVVGLVGLIVFQNPFVYDMTPFHLLLMGILVFSTEERPSRELVFFVVLTGLLGFVAEIIGVNTGLLFGDYQYGEVLGFKLWDVPLVIGLNWALVLLGSGSLCAMVARKVSPRLAGICIVFGGAVLATAFDWLMEPVAIQLGYWNWARNEIPLFNYICWFLISMAGLVAFPLLRIRPHQFYVLLFGIQTVFFLALRLLL